MALKLPYSLVCMRLWVRLSYGLALGQAKARLSGHGFEKQSVPTRRNIWVASWKVKQILYDHGVRVGIWGQISRWRGGNVVDWSGVSFKGSKWDGRGQAVTSHQIQVCSTPCTLHVRMITLAEVNSLTVGRQCMVICSMGLVPSGPVQSSFLVLFQITGTGTGPLLSTIHQNWDQTVLNRSTAVCDSCLTGSDQY
jgi:hypothetical protein